MEDIHTYLITYFDAQTRVYFFGDRIMWCDVSNLVIRVTGLCAEGALPATLWRIIKDIGVAQFTELLKSNPSTFTTEFQLLGLFCNLTAHLIT